MPDVKPVLVIHGGCGLIPKSSMTKEYEDKCRESLRNVLKAGMDILKRTNSSVEAVVESVRLLEDSPCFNAGKGAVFTSDLTNELDAGLMDGFTGKVGGVSTVTMVKNPILLAVEVMKNTSHSILCGKGAEQFAQKQGLKIVEPGYFYTARRYEQAVKLLKENSDGRVVVPQLDHNVHVEKPNDTVGAVAVDKYGRLAAASSTGGLSGKMPGRVSDSCIAGAGFYADSDVAVSGTGNGDFFIRRSTCLQVAHLIKYEKLNVTDACVKVVREIMADCSAGVIAVDKGGKFSMEYNSEGMFRGYVTDDGSSNVYIWEN